MLGFPQKRYLFLNMRNTSSDFRNCMTSKLDARLLNVVLFFETKHVPICNWQMPTEGKCLVKLYICWRLIHNHKTLFYKDATTSICYWKYLMCLYNSKIDGVQICIREIVCTCLIKLSFLPKLCSATKTQSLVKLTCD